MDPSITKQQASAVAAALPEEIVEQVLLRFPPDDPASLVHAALVSKRWCRLICGQGFRRRFSKFHGAPPLLGYVCLRDHTEQDRLFIPASSFKPRHHGDPRFRCMETVNSCHGRVLLRSLPRDEVADPEEDLFVWDPIADELRKLPRFPLYTHCTCYSGNAAVLCAGTVADDGCDHLDCHRGPFMVVFMGPDRNGRPFHCVYSSEAGRWSHPVYFYQRHSYFGKGNSVLIGTAVYFKMSPDAPAAILKYDLLTRELFWIRIPLPGLLPKLFQMQATLLVMEGGRLGFAFTEFTSEMHKLHLWSMEHDPDENASWESRVMDLDKLLPTQLGRWTNVHVGFADTGAAGVILWLYDDDRLFSLNLKSGCTKVVQEKFGVSQVVPYMSFCTPALGAVSIEEGPGASEPSA